MNKKDRNYIAIIICQSIFFLFFEWLFVNWALDYKHKAEVLESQQNIIVIDESCSDQLRSNDGIIRLKIQ